MVCDQPEQEIVVVGLRFGMHSRFKISVRSGSPRRRQSQVLLTKSSSIVLFVETLLAGVVFFRGIGDCKMQRLESCVKNSVSDIPKALLLTT